MKLEDCCITVECLPEDVPIEGNASAIGRFVDRQIAREIRQKLEAGNEWAWCCVRVTVEYEDMTESECLGCCSYKNRFDFINSSGYYQDMVVECFDRLRHNFSTKMTQSTGVSEEPVLAKIEQVSDTGISAWFEVIYYSTEEQRWKSYSGSNTFEREGTEGEVVAFRPISGLKNFMFPTESYGSLEQFFSSAEV